MNRDHRRGNTDITEQITFHLSSFFGCIMTFFCPVEVFFIESDFSFFSFTTYGLQLIVMSLLLCNYRGILPSFLLELLWLHFWHLTCESICKLSSILLQMAVPLSQYILLTAPSFPIGLRCPNGLSRAEFKRKRVTSQKLLPEALYYSAFLCPFHMPTQDLSNPNPRLVFLPA